MIGIFDSGIGGLTVVKALQKKFPRAPMLYFGDVARMPYGNKSAETVLRYSREITSYLVGRGAKVIVIACNTASAVAADVLRKEFKLPILDVITPAVRSALSFNPKRVAVLGTRGTVMSGAYEAAFKKISGERKLKVFSHACPLFVPLVEEGYGNSKEGLAVIKKTLEPLISKKPEVAILGCTHYPLLKKQISELLPKAVLVDSSAVACDLAGILAENPGLIGDSAPKTELVLTDKTDQFMKLAKKILGNGFTSRVINIDELPCLK